MSTDPYRFVTPRPDPPPTKLTFKENIKRLWEMYKRWSDRNIGLSSIILITLLLGGLTAIVVPSVTVFNGRLVNKTTQAARSWARAHDGQVTHCNSSLTNLFCIVRTPQENYRIVFSDAGETEPYIVAKELP